MKHFSPLDFRCDGLVAFYPLDYANPKDASANGYDLSIAGQPEGTFENGVTYSGHAIMQEIIDRVPNLVPYELESASAGTVEQVPEVYSITHANIRGIGIDLSLIHI